MNINETIQINNQLALLIENEELDDDTIRDTYEFIKAEIENNSNNLVAYYKELDADIEKNKNMSKAYAEYAKRLEKRKAELLVQISRLQNEVKLIESQIGKIDLLIEEIDKEM